MDAIYISEVDDVKLFKNEKHKKDFRLFCEMDQRQSVNKILRWKRSFWPKS